MLSDASRRSVRVGAAKLGSWGGPAAAPDDLNRRFHELESELQQEREARLQLHAQLQEAFVKLEDQGAGLHTLIDLLENTATRTDLQALADETVRDTETQLQSVSDNLNATIQQQAADFDRLCSSM